MNLTVVKFNYVWSIVKISFRNKYVVKKVISIRSDIHINKYTK